MKIDIELLKNPTVSHFEDDEYVVYTNYGQLGGTYTFERAAAIRQWLIEAAAQLEREQDKVDKMVVFPENPPPDAA